MAPMFFESGSSSSSSSLRSSWTYDVFLSFRGEDTRTNFTDHLYTALVQAGIHTFRDDVEVPRGEEISTQILNAIQESRISIVVFSKDYASSTWCLNELEKIMECKNNIDHIVLPVFYNIDPSNVRKQKRSFAEAFEMHEKRFKEEMEKVNKWRKALKEAANLCGFDLNNMANRHESKFIQKIVEDVLIKLDHKLLFVARHPVGIDSNVDNIMNLLSINTNNVCFVGIYGMPGIGKTTVAKALFNQLCHGFDGCCFLFNVKEKSKKDNGLVQLQKQILWDIVKFKGLNFFDYECRGVNLIKERLTRRKVLLVVDDVDQLKQLEYLVGERSWFGGGSRIIITTRDERLLTQFEVDKKFKVEELNEYKSLQLFSWHAFRNPYPAEDFVELSCRVAGYCKGLPLALEVLGSSLFKRSKHEWISTIEKMKKIPHHQIQDMLQLSLDSLDEDIQKDAFLDIACFFIGWDKEYVAEILDGRGLYPDISIAVLLERSLVTINDYNQFDMHDLIRDTGREIVRKMSLDNPGKRSRIWFHEDALDVLTKHMGTEAVKGLKQDIRAPEPVYVSTKSFTEMRHLELLQLNGVHLGGSYEHLSNELIWLCWHSCPLKYLPSNFQLDNLVVLDIQHSNIRTLWQDTKILTKLKILNLSHSQFLVKMPNFLTLTNLERLVLEDCPNLIELHQSVGHLERLVSLNLNGCCRLKILPESMGNLKSLKTLTMAGCSKLDTLPEWLGDLESLTELIADRTAIRQLPSSIGHLKNLIKLSLAGSDDNRNLPSTSWPLSVISSWLSPWSSNSKALLLPASLFGLSTLIDLNLCHCGLSDGMISKPDFRRLSSLKWLHLSGNEFSDLPSGVRYLPNLQILDIVSCTNLVSISDLPSTLTVVNANDCTSLESLSVPLSIRPAVFLTGCQNLREIQGTERAGDSWLLTFKECNKLSNNCKESIVQKICKSKQFEVYVDGGEIPAWFSHHGEGSSLSFKVLDGMLEALFVWAVVSVDTTGSKTLRGDYFLENKSSGKQLLKRATWDGTADPYYSNHSRVSHMTLTELLNPCAIQSGDELELSVRLVAGQVKEFGIHMIVKRPDDDDDVESSTYADAALWRSCLVKELLQWPIYRMSTGQFVQNSIP